MKTVSKKKSNFQNYFGDSKFGMEVDLIETIQKSYILHVRTLKTELDKAPKASARGQCSLVTPLRCALLFRARDNARKCVDDAGLEKEREKKKSWLNFVSSCVPT